MLFILYKGGSYYTNNLLLWVVIHTMLHSLCWGPKCCLDYKLNVCGVIWFILSRTPVAMGSLHRDGLGAALAGTS